MIRPIPLNHGVGFFSMERLPQFAGKYREENVGRYWNYYVTPDCQEWPEKVECKGPYIIDGFSPNLNKNLHVGHLRQLAIAKSLAVILNGGGANTAKFVAILGASQGVYQYAVDALQDWFEFLKYNPTLYYDVLMPREQEFVPRREAMMPHLEDESRCEVWDGPKGPVIVSRSDGRPTYAFADIAFAKLVGPTHYITGAEQQDHFANLGLGDKHLPMGLVLGGDNKKMKSRTGDAVSAEEVIAQIISQLDPTPNPKKLAWNVLAWNFLHVARSKNVKYTPEEWTKPEAPGMYITYTYARIKSAMKGNDRCWWPPSRMKAIAHNYMPECPELEEGQSWSYDDACEAWSKENPDPKFDLNQADADLIGLANQHRYALQRSIDTLDPAPIANFAYDLAAKLGAAYHSEQIKGGRYGFQYSVDRAVNALRTCMWKLGMFALEEV